MLRTKPLMMSVLLATALLLSACQPKATEPELMPVENSSEMPPDATIPPSMVPTLQKNMMKGGGQSSNQTPEQEVDSAIREMDTAVNANSSNDFKSSDFNF